VTGVECHLQKPGEFDASGRRRPIPIEESEFEGAEFVLDADIFIPAIGQIPESECLTHGSKAIGLNRDGTVTVGANLATNREGVFAAGDLALGPATVIEAVAQGNKAVVAVDAYLKGQPIERPKFITEFREVSQLYNIEDYAEAKRPVMRELPVGERIHNFEEAEAGIDEQKAREECKRCLRCDLEWLESMGLRSEAKKVA
jgi:NADPH-dependent glutamate synthase beta subunit-like oxidoreductase